jgi:redox-sensitive bicupin YhaK (pirin superfamily)
MEPVELETFVVRSERGSPLRAVLPHEGTARYDPFLVLHEQGPVAYPPRGAIGFPDHPHRGFETVTYVIEGEQLHRDSFGHGGVLHAGDVQWMSAGAGIVHSELPTERLFAEGGRVHALQIWINLPRARKMERPRYQDVAAARLPVLVDHERWVRVIAGAHRGAISPVEAGRPVSFVHLDFAAGARDVFTLPPGSTALIYVMTGSAVVRDREVGAQTIAIARNVDEFPLAAGDDGCTAVVLAAQPLHEPVVSRGPFVMNTLAEIEHAYDDLFAGTLGVEARVD